MFKFIKKAFIVLVSFSGSLFTKCMSVNNETYFARPTLID